ncbi:hypothetical protein CLOM_g12991 [Closterium sp. NIES-68]|nr:hypothetical protein CLOM_g12991 [Closterium sp. NIES-68]
MALKFLNKKGWHTGSLRNVEKVWKAEQREADERKKVDELRKQIADEREAEEFQRLREQAGLVPLQQRVDFLYESGLSTGKGMDGGAMGAMGGPSTDELMSQKVDFSAPKQGGAPDISNASTVPGSLFAADGSGCGGGEEEAGPVAVSANEMWRRLHSDPLVMIRQREQEALARIRNNPVKMGMIRAQAEVEKGGKSRKEKKREKKERKRKRKEERRARREKKKRRKQSDSESSSSGGSSEESEEERRGRGREGGEGKGSRRVIG